MQFRSLGNTSLTVSETGLGCGKRCPFGVKIRENMARAKTVFGY